MGTVSFIPTQGHTVPYQLGTLSTSCIQKLTSYKEFPQQPRFSSCSKNPLW